MAQKFRVQEIKVKSWLSNRSGIITENMTSATPDKVVGTTFKNVLVNENWEQVVWPEAKTICELETVTQLQADTLDLSDLKLVVCGTWDSNIDGKTVSIDMVAGLFWISIAPIMWWTWTSTVANITATWSDLTWTYTSDWWSAITATGFVVYPSWNPSTIIGWLNVLDFPDATLTSPVTSTSTWLTGWTNYCAKPYAINSVWTSYWEEVCFTTLSAADIVITNWTAWVSFRNSVTNAIAATVPIASNNVNKIAYGNWKIAVSWSSTNKLTIIDATTYTVLNTITLSWLPRDIAYWNWKFCVLSDISSAMLVDATTNLTITTLTFGFNAVHWVAYGNGKFAVSAWWGIRFIDATTNALITTTTVPWTNARWVAYWNGKFACLDQNLNACRFLDDTTHAVLSTVTTGTAPQRVVFWNWKFYVFHSTTTTPSIIDATTLVATVSTVTAQVSATTWWACFGNWNFYHTAWWTLKTIDWATDLLTATLVVWATTNQAVII